MKPSNQTSTLLVVVPLFPAVVILFKAAAVPVALMGETPGRINFRLPFITSVMASVSRKAVESFNTWRVSG